MSVLALVLTFTLGCNDEQISIPNIEASANLYWRLNINYPAIRMSMEPPYDTVTVTANPYTIDGSELMSVGPEYPSIRESATTWYSTDSATVRVSSTGLITALKPTGIAKVYVVATRTIQNVSREDRALVQVVHESSPPRITSIVARPADSLKRAGGQALLLAPIVRDTNGAVVNGLPIHFRSFNPLIASIADPWRGTILAGNILQKNTIGTSKIVASTWAYGVSVRDTFTLEVGWPLSSLYIVTVAVKSVNSRAVTYLQFPEIHIGPGGVVRFTNSDGIKESAVTPGSGLLPSNGSLIDYIFDDSLSVKAVTTGAKPTADGNIFSVSGDTLKAPAAKAHYRMFPKPGRFEFTAKPYGFRGVIVVHDR